MNARNYYEFTYFFYTSLYASCCVFLASIVKDLSFLVYIMCNSYYDSDLEQVILYKEEDKETDDKDKDKDTDDKDKDKDTDDKDQEEDVKKKLVIKYEDKYLPEWNRLISNHDNSNNQDTDKNKDLHVAKHAYLLELCPLGNVCIFFNDELECFEYYSDFTIPFRFLETIGRKYAIVYKCPDIYIDMKMEIDKATQHSKEEKEKEKDKEKEKEEKPDEKSNNIFANFKSYNGSSKKSDIPMSKGRSPNALQIPDSLKRKFKASINEEELSVLKEKSNRYLYKGKLSNFNWLQKPPNKRENISYKDFIKAQQSNKY